MNRRSDKEMMDTILGFAAGDERIRAVMMNGSRVNPDAPRDLFQDYDIVYFVTSVDDFVADRSWIRRFGDILIMQTPDDNVVPPNDRSDSFAFLMLFTDGNRIDLTYCPVERISRCRDDSLSLMLLDKDGIAGDLPPPSNHDYLPAPPSAKQFADCCNEFWWVSTYVAKGLWRDELPYAKFMVDRPVRDMVALMLTWHIGIRSGFTADPGKCGKYFKSCLEPAKWESYVRTYADADVNRMWDALFEMGDLFRDTAIGVANRLGFEYPFDDDNRVTAYLKHVRALPKSAGRLY
ncbi:aminoglycoside 6-adenylyltransferase [Paenibacillus flagellatus]|uniref:Aminoglycoside adenylyltransferase n=1 Tax=Paenibacillus flagellatus TaxID=2211139 RepID=A0A2V5KBY7_9BACL|nr:aminoglycoside 6-adenylyltransferase [Paenibacillus flagellatus]PYI55664.1 aminoglycoside adenylyltransferase [Paenibacillus flagellatus]